MQETVNAQQKKLKEDAQSIRKMNQGKYGNKTPNGGGEKNNCGCLVCIIQSRGGRPHQRMG